MTDSKKSAFADIQKKFFNPNAESDVQQVSQTANAAIDRPDEVLPEFDAFDPAAILLAGGPGDAGGATGDAGAAGDSGACVGGCTGDTSSGASSSASGCATGSASGAATTSSCKT